MTTTDTNTLTEQERKESWELLFDGRTLDGWMCPYEDHGWTVTGGTIALERPIGRRRNLYTVERFGDFALKLDYRSDPKCNSGLFLRTSDIEDPVNTGIEIQILDTHGSGRLDTHTCGAIYDLVAPRIDASRPAGEWNTFEIAWRGPLLSVILNGERIADMDVSRWTEAGKNPDGSPNKFKYAWNDLPREGHIGLQDHNGRLWFRNLKLKRL